MNARSGLLDLWLPPSWKSVFSIKREPDIFEQFNDVMNQILKLVTRELGNERKNRYHFQCRWRTESSTGHNFGYELLSSPSGLHGFLFKPQKIAEISAWGSYEHGISIHVGPTKINLRNRKSLIHVDAAFPSVPNSNYEIQIIKSKLKQGLLRENAFGRLKL